MVRPLKSQWVPWPAPPAPLVVEPLQPWEMATVEAVIARAESEGRWWDRDRVEAMSRAEHHVLARMEVAPCLHEPMRWGLAS